MTDFCNLRITGNTVHPSWYKTMTFKNDRGVYSHWLAINILSDLIYWYTPFEIRDQMSGQVSGYKSKFEGAFLYRSIEETGNLFNASERLTRDAVEFLEARGLVFRTYKNEAKKTGVAIVPCLPFILLHTFPDAGQIPETINFTVKSGSKYTNGVESKQFIENQVNTRLNSINIVGYRVRKANEVGLPIGDPEITSTTSNIFQIGEKMQMLLSLNSSDMLLNNTVRGVIGYNYVIPTITPNVLDDFSIERKISIRDFKNENFEKESEACLDNDVTNSLPLQEDFEKEKNCGKKEKSEPVSFSNPTFTDEQYFVLAEKQLLIRSFLKIRYQYLFEQKGEAPGRDEVYFDIKTELGKLFALRNALLSKVRLANVEHALLNDKRYFIESVFLPFLQSCKDIDDQFLKKYFVPSWIYSQFERFYSHAKGNNSNAKKSNSAITAAKQRLKATNIAGAFSG